MYNTLWSRHKYVKCDCVPILFAFRAINELTNQPRLHCMNYPLSCPYLSQIINHTFIYIYSKERTWLLGQPARQQQKIHSVQPTLGCWSLSSRRNRREELSFPYKDWTFLPDIRHLLWGKSARNVSQWITSLFIVLNTLIYEIVTVSCTQFKRDKRTDLVDPANIIGFLRKTGDCFLFI